jgi:hypothetical protein
MHVLKISLQFRSQHIIELTPNRFEEVGSLNSCDQVIGPALQDDVSWYMHPPTRWEYSKAFTSCPYLVFHGITCLVRQDADLFVRSWKS